MRGRIVGLQGLISERGYLGGGVEVGPIASAFTISTANGINVGEGSRCWRRVASAGLVTQGMVPKLWGRGVE